MADTTTKRAVQCEIDGNKIFLPTSADMVTDLPEFIDEKIAAFNTGSLANQISALDNKYLAKTGKAANSAKADSCTTAVKATQDGDGRVIKTTYYTTDATVAKASADAQGANFVDNYAKKTGTYSGMTVGNATNATNATNAAKATNDGSNQQITSTYIKAISVNGTTFKYTYGSGAQSTTTLQDTTYGLATQSQAGLMSANDKKRVDELDLLIGPNQIKPDENYDGDFNNITVTGFFNVRSIGNWKHRPAGIGTASHSLLSFHTNAGAVQLLFNQDSTDFFQRTYLGASSTGTPGHWTGWAKVSGVAVDTIEE